MKWLMLAGTIFFLGTAMAQDAIKQSEPNPPTKESLELEKRQLELDRREFELQKKEAAHASGNPPTESKPFIKEDSAAWHWGLGAGLMLAAAGGKFNDAKFTGTGGTITGSADLEYSKVLSLLIEGRMLPRDSWGTLIGLNHEFERNFEGGTISGGGTTVTMSGSGNVSKMQFTTLYASAAYRWETFYLPFGLNFNSVTFTPASGATGNSSASGSVGVQLGGGWMISPTFAVEAYSWVTSMKLKATNTTDTLDYGIDNFGSLRVFGKFIF